jgi:glycine cleavage system H protein
LGDIVYVDITTVGNEMKARQVIRNSGSVKTVSDLFLPVAGTILTINPFDLKNNGTCK